MSYQDSIVSFASITKLKNNKNEVIIVDYFGIAKVSPISIVRYFNFERFRGKGVGKLLMNLIQIISNMLSYGVENVIMLKCAKELESFYETTDFEEIYHTSKWLHILEVIDHYDVIKATIPLKTFILNLNSGGTIY